MAGNKSWTKDEIEFLKENWGNKSVALLSRKLKRSEVAIKLKAQKIGLGAFLRCGDDYVTFNELYRKLTGHNVNSYQMISWVENKDFPIHYKRVGKNRFRIVRLEEFWKWAKINQDFLDFSNMEKGELGVEPAWVAEKRKMDVERKRNIRNKNTIWSKDEDNKLRYYLSLHKYTLSEMAKKLNRTSGAIQRRINTLNIMDRPVPACKSRYTECDEQKIKEMLLNGCTYHEMSVELGKSESAIRGYLYRQYGTERLSQVKQQLMKVCA